MRNTCFILAVHNRIRHDHCSYGENKLYQTGIHSCDKCSSRMLALQVIKQSAILTIKMSGRLLLQKALKLLALFWRDSQGFSVSRDVLLLSANCIFELSDKPVDRLHKTWSEAKTIMVTKLAIWIFVGEGNWETVWQWCHRSSKYLVWILLLSETETVSLNTLFLHAWIHSKTILNDLLSVVGTSHIYSEQCTHT